MDDVTILLEFCDECKHKELRVHLSQSVADIIMLFAPHGQFSLDRFQAKLNSILKISETLQ